MHPLRLLLICGILLSLMGCQAQHEPAEPTLEMVLERNAEARGGRAMLDTLNVVWARLNDRAFFVRKRPHFMIVLVLDEAGGVAYAEGFNGEVSWEQVDNGPRYETTGRPRVALWHTTQIPSSLVALYQLPGLGHRVRYLGQETIENQPYHRVLVTLSDEWEVDYYVDAQTYLATRSRNVRRFHAVDPNLRKMEAIWSDYRDVDGYLIPHAIKELDLETKEVLSEGSTEAFRVNVSIPDEAFGLQGDHRVFIDPAR